MKEKKTLQLSKRLKLLMLKESLTLKEKNTGIGINVSMTSTKMAFTTPTLITGKLSDGPNILALVEAACYVSLLPFTLKNPSKLVELINHGSRPILMEASSTKRALTTLYLTHYKFVLTNNIKQILRVILMIAHFSKLCSAQFATTNQQTVITSSVLGIITIISNKAVDPRLCNALSLTKTKTGEKEDKLKVALMRSFAILSGPT